MEKPWRDSKAYAEARREKGTTEVLGPEGLGCVFVTPVSVCGPDLEDVMSMYPSHEERMLGGFLGV